MLSDATRGRFAAIIFVPPTPAVGPAVLFQTAIKHPPIKADSERVRETAALYRKRLNRLRRAGANARFWESLQLVREPLLASGSSGSEHAHWRSVDAPESSVGKPNIRPAEMFPLLPPFARSVIAQDRQLARCGQYSPNPANPDGPASLLFVV